MPLLSKSWIVFDRSTKIVSTLWTIAGRIRNGFWRKITKLSEERANTEPQGRELDRHFVYLGEQKRLRTHNTDASALRADGALHFIRAVPEVEVTSSRALDHCGRI